MRAFVNIAAGFAVQGILRAEGDKDPFHGWVVYLLAILVFHLLNPKEKS